MAFEPFQILGLDDLIEKLEGTEGALSDPQLWAQIGSFLKAQILLRTAEGKSYEDDSTFDPYSVSYAKVRAKKGLPIDKVDLFFGGNMLGALQFEEDASLQQVRLYFLDTSDKTGTSNAAKAYYNQQKRKFFGWSAEDVTDIENMVMNYLIEALENG